MRPMPELRRHLAGLLLLLAAGLAGAVQAQNLGQVQSPILTIDSERFFSESAFGRRVADDIEAAGSELAAENRRIEAELSAEEKSLTEQRPEMEPEDFREVADAFDEKVERIRREQEAKARALGQRSEDRRRRYLIASQPVLEAIMQAAGAAVIVERRTVFLSADVIDVTDIAIQRMNEAFGSGEDLEAPQDEEAGQGTSLSPDAPLGPDTGDGTDQGGNGLPEAPQLPPVDGGADQAPDPAETRDDG